MITPLQQLQAMVPAPFSVEVLYRPKDLVGGDFYWAGSWKNKTVLALGDGSGHGVPGAFMCTVGISLIAKLVEDRGITEPASLLDELDTEVKNLLNQENELTERVEESLEASVLTFMPGKTQVAFAAALRPALLVRRGEVVVFGADRRPVGGTLHDPKPFTHQLIDFEPGDTLYLFSDGFAHQMGGPSPEGKKFGMAAFRELLQKAAQLGSLQEQVRLLTTTLEDWQDGKHPQTDDVIVVIVRCQAASS
jgi:serine phosphatase RsbU (regulator of sigma subunit)